MEIIVIAKRDLYEKRIDYNNQLEQMLFDKVSLFEIFGRTLPSSGIKFKFKMEISDRRRQRSAEKQLIRKTSRKIIRSLDSAAPFL